MKVMPTDAQATRTPDLRARLLVVDDEASITDLVSTAFR